MAFTEFYCDNTAGSNLNGGAPIGGVYPITYTSGSWVASWYQQQAAEAFPRATPKMEHTSI